MGRALLLLGLAGLLFVLGSLARPTGRLGVATPRQAGLVAAVSLLIVVLGGCLIPPRESAPAETGALVDADAAPTTDPATSPATTSSAPTTPGESATTLPLPTTTNIDPVFAAIGPGSSGDPRGSPPPAASSATVVSITDGDTLDVALAGGQADTVRLIGTNSPEPGECFAEEAARVLSILVPPGSEIAMTDDVSDRDQYGRLLRYLWVGSLSVNEEMVRRGAALARRYPPDTTLAARLEQAQMDARDRQLGLWQSDACGQAAGTGIVVTAIEADAPGDDNEDLNAELVRLANSGEMGVDMTGWALKDESAGNRYRFPAGYTLAAGATVVVHSGCGTDSGTSLYWCSSGAVWNNDGDTAFVLDANGNTVHSLAYVPPVLTTSGEENAFSGGSCDPSYPDVCIPPPPPDLDCRDIPQRRFRVVGSDSHGFDGNRDGLGCES